MAQRSKKDKKQNPNNPQNKLFKQLTRLLSGPVIRYRRQDTRQLKRRQLEKYKTRFRSASGQEFKMHAYGEIYGSLQAEYYSNQNRLDRYVDFDQMEYTPEIASSLDIYADEMTTSSLYRPVLNIDCSNLEIKTVLDTLFTDVLNIKFNLYGWCRSMCKYGDFFVYLDIEEDEGVKNCIGLPPTEIERLEGEDKMNPNYVQFQWNSAGLTLENWQVGHFRILGHDKFAPYGTSILEGARRIWRQLTLLEDAVMAYRIVRSPERRVFYIDVGNVPPQDVEQYMQKVMSQMKRNQIVDQDSGRVDLRYNPLSIEEDYYVPVRGGASNTKIETVGGGKYTGDIEDVKYLRDKLFSALKVPASYLSSDDSPEDKATLAQKDMRFARTVQRLQRSVISELEKIALVHLFTLGYRGNDLLSFRLSLNNPSKLAELQELEHWKARFDAADAASEGYFSRRWVARNILNISEDEFQRMQVESYYDKKHDLALEQIGDVAAAEGAGGGGGLELGGEAGGAEGGDVDLGAAPDEPAEGADEPAAEESPVLASPGEGAPGKRDEDFRYYEKSKYKPVKSDKRDLGAHKRATKGLYAREKASGTERNIMPGKSEIESLFKLSESNYDEEEIRLFKQKSEVTSLIESLEKKYDES
jgi:hypothetical protein